MSVPNVPGLELRRSSGALAAVEQHAAFELRPLIWETIKEHLNPSEIDEIRSIIGVQLIEDNETVQNEIHALIEIWNEFRKTVDDKLESAAKQPRGALPEPPGRELLERKIMIMIARLEQKSAIRGKGIDMEVVPVETPREKEIVDYISVRKQQPTRPKSASPRDGRPATASPRDPLTGKPLMLPTEAPVDTRPAPATPRTSGATLPLEKMRAKLNVYDIESIKDELRQALQEEHAMLVEDAAYLQKCIDDEMLYQREAESYAKKIAAKTPTLQDLQEFGSKLEKKLLAEREQRERRDQPSSGDLRRSQQQLQSAPPATPPSPAGTRQRASSETALGASRPASVPVANGKVDESMPPPPARRLASGRLEPLSPLRPSVSRDSQSRESSGSDSTRHSIDLSTPSEAPPP